MTILSTLYLAAGIMCALAFLPQIRTLWRDRTGAASTNIASWAMFSACNVVTLVYAIQANGDPYFVACSGLCMLGNISVCALAILRRTQTLAFVKRKA